MERERPKEYPKLKDYRPSRFMLLTLITMWLSDKAVASLRCFRIPRTLERKTVLVLPGKSDHSGCVRIVRKTGHANSQAMWRFRRKMETLDIGNLSSDGFTDGD